MSLIQRFCSIRMSLSNQQIKSLPALKKCRTEKSNIIKHQLIVLPALYCIMCYVFVCVVTVFNLFKLAGIKGISGVCIQIKYHFCVDSVSLFLFIIIIIARYFTISFIDVKKSTNLLSSQ